VAERLLPLKRRWFPGVFFAVHESGVGPSRRFRHLRYFRFGWERTLVNRMPDACKIGVEVNPKVVLGKPIIRGTSRYPARARSGAS
jgi:hypothetical protein